MRLRNRTGKKNDFSAQELAQMALEKMRESIVRDGGHQPQSVSSTASCKSGSASAMLPEVLLLGKDDGGSEVKNDPKQTTNLVKSKSIFLSSSLDPGPLPELYFDSQKSITTLVQNERNKQADQNEETILTSTSTVLSKRAAQKLKKAERQKFAGPKWFNMPAPEITPEVKNDLKIIQIRNSLDRTHYYKSSDWKKKLPKYFQMGTVIEGAADYYSGRIPKRQRKRTILEELLSDKKFKKYHTQKYKMLHKKRQLEAMKRRKRLVKKKK